MNRHLFMSPRTNHIIKLGERLKKTREMLQALKSWDTGAQALGLEKSKHRRDRNTARAVRVRKRQYSQPQLQERTTDEGEGLGRRQGSRLLLS